MQPRHECVGTLYILLFFHDSYKFYYRFLKTALGKLSVKTIVITIGTLYYFGLSKTQ